MEVLGAVGLGSPYILSNLPQFFLFNVSQNAACVLSQEEIYLMPKLYRNLFAYLGVTNETKKNQLLGKFVTSKAAHYTAPVNTFFFVS